MSTSRQRSPHPSPADQCTGGFSFVERLSTGMDIYQHLAPSETSRLLHSDADIEHRSGSQSTNHSLPDIKDLRRTVKSTLGWWTAEYMSCCVCLIALSTLVLLLWCFDGQAEPDLSVITNIKLSTVIIAIMTVYRIALISVVQTCISQAAWIWVSGFRRGRVEARLKDFKMFDEAARGLSGSLLLIWHMRARHFACIGAGIMLLCQGFETFSNQMIRLSEHQVEVVEVVVPPPPRATAWPDLNGSVHRKDVEIGVSMRAAVYNGMHGITVPQIPIECQTGDCIWPSVPSLGMCGNCEPAQVESHCENDGSHCAHALASGTEMIEQNGDLELEFMVSPVSPQGPDVVSGFDVVQLRKVGDNRTVQAWTCSLKFCVRKYSTVVTRGQQISSSSMGVQVASVVRGDEILGSQDKIVFGDTTPITNLAKDRNYYSVPLPAVEEFRHFMGPLMRGSLTTLEGSTLYSSDWALTMHRVVPDLPRWIDRLAASMSNDIRLTGTRDDGASPKYHGTAYATIPRIHVNWYWLLYPLSLMLLAFFCLAQTVWRTADDRVCAWKGDSLPMLFCHVDQTIHAEVGDGMDKPNGLSGKVREIEVELYRGDNGQWFFRPPLHRS